MEKDADTFVQETGRTIWISFMVLVGPFFCQNLQHWLGVTYPIAILIGAFVMLSVAFLIWGRKRQWKRFAVAAVFGSLACALIPVVSPWVQRLANAHSGH